MKSLYAQVKEEMAQGFDDPAVIACRIGVPKQRIERVMVLIKLPNVPPPKPKDVMDSFLYGTTRRESR